MPAYESLNTQIEAVKSEITASLAASTYTAQDLVYVAKALETLANLLGINDIVAATADALGQLNDYLGEIIDGTAEVEIDKLYVGAGAAEYETFASLVNPTIIVRADATDYAQISFQNKNSSTDSSTDFIAYADNGVDDSGYIDMGITSSNFSDPDFTITQASDGYIFMEAPAQLTASVTSKSILNNVATLATSVAHGFRVGMPVVITNVDATFNGNYTITAVTSLTFSYAKVNSDVNATEVSPAGTAVAGKLGRGNLVLATSGNGSQNKIIFAAGGLASDNTQMEITPDVNVHIEIPTPSTSPTTGALTIVGGVGISGDVNIGGDVNISGTIQFSGGGTTVETDNIAVVDPMIYVANGNIADLVDGAFVVEYTSSGTKYAAFFRDASDNDIWKFGSGLTSKPTTTVDVGASGFTYDTVYAKAFRTSVPAAASDELTQKVYVDTADQDNFVSTIMGVLA